MYWFCFSRVVYVIVGTSGFRLSTIDLEPFSLVTNLSVLFIGSQILDKLLPYRHVLLSVVGPNIPPLPRHYSTGSKLRMTCSQDPYQSSCVQKGNGKPIPRSDTKILYMEVVPEQESWFRKEDNKYMSLYMRSFPRPCLHYTTIEVCCRSANALQLLLLTTSLRILPRSEERRVGKECRN